MILTAAVELFAEKGFRSTGIIPLAQRVGMTHTGLLHYFGTKRDLLMAVAQERERVERDRRAWLHGVVPPSGIAGLRSLAETLRRQAEDPLHMRLYHVLVTENLDEGDPLHEFFTDRYRRARKDIARIVRGGINSGEFRADARPREIAADMLAFIIGIERQWLLDPSSVNLTRAYRRAIRNLERDLTRPD